MLVLYFERIYLRYLNIPQKGWHSNMLHLKKFFLLITKAKTSCVADTIEILRTSNVAIVWFLENFFVYAKMQNTTKMKVTYLTKLQIKF